MQTRRQEVRFLFDINAVYHLTESTPLGNQVIYWGHKLLQVVTALGRPALNAKWYFWVLSMQTDGGEDMPVNRSIWRDHIHSTRRRRKLQCCFWWTRTKMIGLANNNTVIWLPCTKTRTRTEMIFRTRISEQELKSTLPAKSRTAKYSRVSKYINVTKMVV